MSGGSGHDLKTYLPSPNILFLLSFRPLDVVKNPDYVKFHTFSKTITKTLHLCGGLGLGLMLMQSMTSENKYALARQVEAESIDPYLNLYLPVMR